MSTPTVEKLGLIFRPPGSGWAQTHGQNPFAQDLGGGMARLHFACRDERKRSRCASLDIGWDEMVTLRTPMAQSPRMTLDIGALGAFDDCGAMPHSVVEVNGNHYLYYTGWSLAVAVPFSFHIGLAVSTDGGKTFERLSRAPILGRTHHDPFIVGAPFVLHDNGIFRMWYISATAWEMAGSEIRHYYTIKHAESADGIAWTTSPQVCLDYGPGEYALARPVVSRRADGYHMLFSARADGGTYRVYQAQSADGVTWLRDPALVLDVSAEGWDSQMVCYAWDFRHGGADYLLYNGNAYGQDGFGLAKLTPP